MDLFNELLSSVDKAISANKHLIEDPDKGLRFRITRSVGAPLTLKVKNERKMLKKRGCVKKVIMLIKYLRDIQMGSMDKIWSHLIKVKCLGYHIFILLFILQTSVMHLVLATDESFWEPANLESCFLESLENLLRGFQEDFISDVFFPKVAVKVISIMTC